MSSWLNVAITWLSSEVLTRLGFLLALIFVANLLRQRRSPSSTIAWLLVILLEPYLGVPLYVVFGGRKMNPRARKKALIYGHTPETRERAIGAGTERLLASYGVPQARDGNRFELVTSGENAFERILELIQEARSTIHITTYILGWDWGSRPILEALRERALSGVAVRVLIDDLGSWRLRRRHLSLLIEAGVQVAYFMPVLHIPFRGRANLRNHRKLIVVDGRIAFTGGMNLALPYLGPPGTAHFWRDLAVIVEGPAVSDIENIFASDWRFTTGTEPGPVPVQALRISSPVDTNDTMQVVASGPDVEGDPLYESLLALIFSAKSRIWIATPYFVPDEILALALNLAARRGVDVRLIVPARSNHVTADLARAGYLRDLHNAGGKVLLYTPIMLHAKVLLFDDDLAIIGSANMDMRSLFLNYELALFLRSKSQVREISEWARELMTHSRRELPQPDWYRELAENVVRLMSPLL